MQNISYVIMSWSVGLEILILASWPTITTSPNVGVRTDMGTSLLQPQKRKVTLLNFPLHTHCVSRMDEFCEASLSCPLVWHETLFRLVKILLGVAPVFWKCIHFVAKRGMWNFNSFEKRERRFTGADRVRWSQQQARGSWCTTHLSLPFSFAEVNIHESDIAHSFVRDDATRPFGHEANGFLWPPFLNAQVEGCRNTETIDLVVLCARNAKSAVHGRHM
jgi:hypothetical protein